MLQKCLTAVASLADLGVRRIECLVVDNDPNGSAREIIPAIQAITPWRIHYCIEPARGLAAVRNRIIHEVLSRQACWIACLDDDEWPDRNWLARHLDALAKFNAHVAAGPVVPISVKNELTVSLSENKKRRMTGKELRYTACNNVVFGRQLVSDQNLRFDTRFNFIGGEDFDFFYASRMLGNRHIWVSDAVMYETIPPERKTVRYMLSRHFSGGINSVVFFRKHHGPIQTVGYFFIRSLGKLATAVVLLPLCVTSGGDYRMRMLRRFANAFGYLAGICKFRFERYRDKS